MSMHECYETMYGIEFPYVEVDGNKVLSFIENHKEYFGGEDLPNTAEEAVEYAKEFDCDENACGLVALVSFVCNKYIYAYDDVYGNEYIGIVANAFFPWETPRNDWASIKREDIENEISSIVEELGIECPKFDTYLIWHFD